MRRGVSFADVFEKIGLNKELEGKYKKIRVILMKQQKAKRPKSRKYVSPSEQPATLEYMTPTGLTACAWDLFLISHERDAWVSNVLKQAAAPDLERYMRARLNGDV